MHPASFNAPLIPISFFPISIAVPLYPLTSDFTSLKSLRTASRSSSSFSLCQTTLCILRQSCFISANISFIKSSISWSSTTYKFPTSSFSSSLYSSSCSSSSCSSFCCRPAPVKKTSSSFVRIGSSFFFVLAVAPFFEIVDFFFVAFLSYSFFASSYPFPALELTYDDHIST